MRARAALGKACVFDSGWDQRWQGHHAGPRGWLALGLVTTESAGRDPVLAAARAAREQQEAVGLCLHQAPLSSSRRCLFYVLKDRSHRRVIGSKEWRACFRRRPGCQDISAGGLGAGGTEPGLRIRRPAHFSQNAPQFCHMSPVPLVSSF